MDEIKMIKTVFLRAPRARVWAFLTEPDLLARWFFEARSTLQADKDFELVRKNPVSDDPRMLWGKVLEAKRPERLVHTFVYHGQSEGLESLVEWSLEELSGGTKLTLTHTNSNAPPDKLWEEAKDTDMGWDDHLSRLRSVFS